MGNKQPRLSEEDLDMLADKTCFTKSQIKQWYKGFMRDCPTGELSRKKFLSIYSTLFPEGKAGPFYEHVFRTFDEDGSGRIDFKEFLQAISVTQAGKPADKLELAFRLYDIDRNGTIDQQEMTDIIKAIYLMTDYDPAEVTEAPAIRTQDIFERMDTNQDGVLSKDEFIRGCLSDERLYKLLACSGSETDQQQTPQLPQTNNGND
jgi:neurocalcin delta